MPTPQQAAALAACAVAPLAAAAAARDAMLSFLICLVFLLLLYPHWAPVMVLVALPAAVVVHERHRASVGDESSMVEAVGRGLKAVLAGTSLAALALSVVPTVTRLATLDFRGAYLESRHPAALALVLLLAGFGELSSGLSLVATGEALVAYSLAALDFGSEAYREILKLYRKSGALTFA
jgi:hypothetical protein